jgi:hypothetical protein
MPRLMVALGFLAMALGALLILELRAKALGRTGLSTPSGHLTSLQAGVPVSTGAASRGDVQARVDAILRRPLFRPDRRPPAGAAPAGPAGLPRLSGILVSSLGKSLIFDGGGAEGKPTVVAEGGRIGVYTVQSIGAGQATVVGPDGPKVLQLSFAVPAAPRPTVAKGPVARPSTSELPHNGSPAPVAATGRAPLVGATPSSGGIPSSQRQ